MRSNAEFNESLESWIKTHCGSVAEDFKKRLCECYGYTKKDMETPLATLINFDSRLLLNNLYEISIFLGMNNEEEFVRNHLKEIAAYSEKKEGLNIPLAHFIWVGKPRENGNELLGVRSLSEKMPDQPVRFWVLDEHVEHYRKLFESNKNISVASIENYAKKINISFDDEGVVTLHGQIEKFKKSAKDKFQEASTNDHKGKEAVRDLVTIVDYMKSLIPLYQSGYIFDSNIIFTKSSEKCLPKREKWLFPKLKLHNGKVGTDVWFFSCTKEMEWQIDKTAAGAFKNKKSDHANWPMHLLIYHKSVCLAEKLADPERRSRIYGSGVMAMTHLNEHHLGVVKYCKRIDEENDKTLLPVAGWFQDSEKAALEKVEYRFATRLAMTASAPPGFPWWGMDVDGVFFVKLLSASHVVGVTHTSPPELSVLAISNIEIFENVIRTMNEYKCCELWKPLSKEVVVNNAILKKGACGIHVAVLYNMEKKFLKLLDVMPKEVLRELCVSPIALQKSGESAETQLTLIELLAQKPELLNAALQKLDKNFSDINFCNANLSGVEVNNADLNNMIINANTKFEGIVGVKNVVCEQFSYRLSESNEEIKINTADFIEQFKKLQSQKSTGYHFFPTRGVKNLDVDSDVTNGTCLLSILSGPLAQSLNLDEMVKQVTYNRNQLFS